MHAMVKHAVVMSGAPGHATEGPEGECNLTMLPTDAPVATVPGVSPGPPEHTSFEDVAGSR